MCDGHRTSEWGAAASPRWQAAVARPGGLSASAIGSRRDAKTCSEAYAVGDAPARGTQMRRWAPCEGHTDAQLGAPHVTRAVGWAAQDKPAAAARTCRRVCVQRAPCIHWRRATRLCVRALPARFQRCPAMPAWRDLRHATCLCVRALPAWFPRCTAMPARQHAGRRPGAAAARLAAGAAASTATTTAALPRQRLPASSWTDPGSEESCTRVPQKSGAGAGRLQQAFGAICMWPQLCPHQLPQASSGAPLAPPAPPSPRLLPASHAHKFSGGRT